MADDLVSKKTLKQYLEGIDVDTSNFDNDEIDGQYLSKLTKRDGSQLSKEENIMGEIKLKQYLGDYQAQQNLNNNISLAENQARQDIAYNDYVNSKLAKYLNIAEENNGTAGYTGITQGNRIQLANQEKNIASQIEQNKQSTIKDYLNTYGNQLMTNSMKALDQETTAQATLDEIANNKYSAYEIGVETALGNIEQKYKPNNDGSYSTAMRDEMFDFIDKSSKLTDEDKAEMKRQIEAQNTFKAPDNNGGGSGGGSTDADGNIVDNLGYNHSENMKTAGASGAGKPIDEATNNAGRLYTFNKDNKDYYIRATFDNNNGNVGGQIQSTLGRYNGLDKNKLNNEISSLEKKSWGAFTFNEDDGDEYAKVIVYKKENGECVVFVRKNSYNKNYDSDFNTLWNQIKNKNTNQTTA